MEHSDHVSEACIRRSADELCKVAQFLRSCAAVIGEKVEGSLARWMEQHVGHRGLRSFAARAVDRHLERETLGRYLDELDVEFGPVPDELIEEFDALWP